MRTLSPAEFRDHLADPGILLLDVRTPEEAEVASLPCSTLVPLQVLPARWGDLNPDAVYAIYCHHGVRSELAGRFLEARGFGKVSHLAGGIDAWSVEIDPDVPRY